MNLNLQHLMIVPVLSTALLVGVACKEEGPKNDKAVIWTYEMSGEFTNGAKKKIGARYTYGGRAAQMSSSSGKVSTKPKTAGPKRASINVTAPGGGEVRCKIVVKKGGDRVATITKTSSASLGATCEFRP